MPDVIMDDILEYLDFPGVLSLRKVCHQLRDFIDETKSKCSLKDINISIYHEKIILEYFSSHNEIHKIKYQKSDQQGTEVIYEETRTVLRNRNFMEISLQDLEIVLKSQKSLIRLFKILGSNHDQYVERLSEILKNRPRPLQVDEFHMYIDKDQQEVLKILPIIDEKSIGSISIYPNSEDPGVLKIDEVAKLGHWKRSEQLYISKFIVDIRSCGIEVFGHFSLVEMKVEKISGEEVIRLKEIFLPSPLFAICGIKFLNFENTSNFLKSCTLTEVHITSGKQEKVWFYGKSEIEDEILRISFCEQQKQIEFKKIRRADMTNHVEVKY